jgi:hypothetical protein
LTVLSVLFMLFLLMKDLLKNKMVLIAAAVVAAVLVLGVFGMLVLGKGSKSATDQAVSGEPTQAPILTLKPEEIGLSFAPDANIQRGTMVITKTSDIASVDYQLTYTATVTGEPVARGTIGHVDVKTKGQQISQTMVFGTCSDVCHYDAGITDVKLIVKVTKANGNIYQVELVVPLSAAK